VAGLFPESNCEAGEAMTVDEERMQLRERLEELVGVGGAEILMDRPPGGWGDLVTNRTLDLRFTAFEERFDAKVDALEARVDRKLDALEARMDLRFAAVDARFADMDHRFDLFEHQLLAQVDRRLRSQAWMTISTIVAVGGVIVAAIRL
jgi:hypothetical protein